VLMKRRQLEMIARRPICVLKDKGYDFINALLKYSQCVCS